MDSMYAKTIDRKPRWVWLYALVPAAFLLLWGADLIPVAGFWRILAECGAVLAVCVLAKVWVSANRVALTRVDVGIALDAEVDSPDVLQSYPGRTSRIQPQPLAVAQARLRAVR
jgi:hypothetical protein